METDQEENKIYTIGENEQITKIIFTNSDLRSDIYEIKQQIKLLQYLFFFIILYIFNKEIAEFIDSIYGIK